MADLRKDPGFAAAVVAARASFETYATRFKVPDAVALHRRQQGQNNLQGHAHSIIPLAILIARAEPSVLPMLRTLTKLKTDMAYETLPAAVSERLKSVTRDVVRRHGADVITEELGSGKEQTARKVAKTYLPTSFGGSHSSGGGGATVVKRTLKLLAHLHIA